MKQKRMLWLLLPVIAAGILLAGMIWLRIPAGWRAMNLLTDTMVQESASGTGKLRFGRFSGEAFFSWSEINRNRYYWMEVSGESLFLHDNALWFDNGTGYDLSGAMADLGIPVDIDPKMLLLAGFETVKSENNTIYQAQLTARQAELLSKFDPDSASFLSMVPDCTLTLTEQNEKLTELTLTGNDFSLELHFFDTPGKSIPTEILMQIGTSEATDLRILKPLFSAGTELLSQDVFGADVNLDLACGPLPISDTARIYGTTEGLFFVRGDLAVELYPEGVTGSPSLFLGLGATLCREGVWETTSADSGVFRLHLAPEAMDAVFLSILPELEGLGIHLNGGEMTISIEQNRITELTLSCNGEMPFLIATIPLELNVTLNRMTEPVELPPTIE